MAENPLLPNVELQALLAQLRRCVALEKRSSGASLTAGTRSAATGKFPGSREALLAATSVQLGPGDLLVPADGDLSFRSLAPRLLGKDVSAPEMPQDLGRKGPRLLLAAAMAAGLQAAGTDRLVLVDVRGSGPEPGWQQALTWAQEQSLPLIILCADPSGSSAFQARTRATADAFYWASVQMVVTRVKLPVLTVDGEDAVGIYRVMQESVLRARSGGGPAMLWAMLPTAKELAARTARSAKPLARLEQYLRTRKIPLHAEASSG